MPRSRGGLQRPPVPRGLESWLRRAAASLELTEEAVLVKLRELCVAAYKKDNIALLPSAKDLAAAGGWSVNLVRRVVKSMCDSGVVVRLGGGAQTKYVPADKVRRKG